MNKIVEWNKILLQRNGIIWDSTVCIVNKYIKHAPIGQNDWLHRKNIVLQIIGGNLNKANQS